MELLFSPEAWVALATLTALEIVLGIDNIIFISLLSGRLPAQQQPRARVIGLALAMIMRIGLLLSLTWIMKLTAPLFAVFGHQISGRDLILLCGGLFLIGKATLEIHEQMEGNGASRAQGPQRSFSSTLFQIVLLDLVFSLDSVITAVGMVDDIPIMVAAVVIAVIAMMLFAGPVSDFVSRHITVKMLALSFLLLIGVVLVADGLSLHIPKGYVYFAVAFSVFVEMINLRVRKG